jgi:glycosyltransferase involved in cell wall biosynthesis
MVDKIINKYKMKISICIPTWEQYNKGVEFLKKNLDSILSQTYKNFNIIISDHSKNEDIKLLCEQYSDKIEIKYFKNERNYGNSPYNTNNSIINANGDIIKIMFQDDFFYQNNALELIVEKFKNDKCYWLVSGCNHTSNDGQSFFNFMVPYWNNKIPIGVNTISSPSVLAFRKNLNVAFDDNLVMLMDCEIYYNFYTKYGLPTIIPETLITNRLHDNQISSKYNLDINDEINYVKNKYNIL